MADGWLSSVLGYHRIKNALNALFPQRSTLKFVGATVTDDPTNKQTVVDLTAGVNGNVTVRRNSGADVGTRPRINLIEGAGVTITAADDAGGAEVDITIAAPGAAAPTLQSAYSAGGNVDANVSDGSNPLRVRAAGNTADVLLQIRRNLTDADVEQSSLKAPDAVTIGVDGTRLIISGGAGKDATGSDDGSHAGSIEITGRNGGAAVNGEAGRGAGITLTGGNAGAVSGASATVNDGGGIGISGGIGSASSHASVAGGPGGSISINAGAGGAGSGGEGGSADGADGAIEIGVQDTSQITVGASGVPLQLLGGKVTTGSATPVGTVTGTPGDIYIRRSTTSSAIYVHRGSVSNNTGWVEYLSTAGGTLTTVKTSPTAAAFSGTPSFDLTANDHHVLGQLTANIAVTFTNPAAGQSGKIDMVQDGTGGRKITGITVAGFTVLCKNNAFAVNPSAQIAASARFTLYYELVTINGVNICFVWTGAGGTPDYS